MNFQYNIIVIHNITLWPPDAMSPAPWYMCNISNSHVKYI